MTEEYTLKRYERSRSITYIYILYINIIIFEMFKIFYKSDYPYLKF